MFILNGKPLSPDTAFTAGDIQYPSNWLRLASAEEREAVGITEVADLVRADDRFYWDGDPAAPKVLEDKPAFKEDGSPLFVQVYDSVTESMVDTTEQVVTQGLKSQLIAQVKITAGAMLSATDWRILRDAEGVKPVDAATLAERQAIREASGANEAAISACLSVKELAALMLDWPKA